MLVYAYGKILVPVVIIDNVSLVENHFDGLSLFVILDVEPQNGCRLGSLVQIVRIPPVNENADVALCILNSLSIYRDSRITYPVANTRPCQRFV